LAEDAADSVRVEVALNPNCPEDLLEIFSRDNNTKLRISAASNSHLKTEILKRLAEDVDPEVRAVVAERIQSPLILKLLSRDADPRVRIGVTRNPNVHELILSDLTSDSDIDVARSAIRELHTKFLEQKYLDIVNYY
jgi:hypothetical protein